jgi:hypothetical protein
VNAPVVQISARAAFGGEELVLHGVEHHAGNNLFAARERKRDVEDGEAVGEVGGAIQRIDKPGVLGRRRVAAAFLGHDAMRREVRAEALDDEFFRGAISFGDQVELALAFEGDAALVVIGHQRARLARNLYRFFEYAVFQRRLTHFLNVFDVVLEDEEIRLALAREADEGLIVVLDGAGDFLAVHHLHAHGRRILDEALEILGLFKRLFGRARRLPTNLL